MNPIKKNKTKGKLTITFFRIALSAWKGEKIDFSGDWWPEHGSVVLRDVSSKVTR